MPNLDDLYKNVGDFLDVYKIMAPEARAAFEAQMDKNMLNLDDSTKALQLSLRNAARDGLSADEAIEKMKRSVQKGKSNKPG